MLRAMPKAKPKRHLGATARTAKPSARKTRASQTSRTKRSGPKAKPSASRNARSATKASALNSAAIDPRIVLAITLALEDERVLRERAEELMQPASAWVALGKTRSVQTR